MHMLESAEIHDYVYYHEYPGPGGEQRVTWWANPRKGESRTAYGVIGKPSLFDATEGSPYIPAPAFRQTAAAGRIYP